MDDRRQQLNPAGVAAIPVVTSSTPPEPPPPPSGARPSMTERPEMLSDRLGYPSHVGDEEWRRRGNTATGPLAYEMTQAIHKHLRILGYSYPGVEWDGALAAARAYAEVKPAATTADWVTVRFEDAQRIFDLAVDTPLVCSGSFETDDVRVLRAFAETIGVDPAKATPSEFVRDFPHTYVPFAVAIERDERRDDASPGGIRWETDEEVYARLGEGPDRCSAGDYNRRCTRPANDPIHQAAREAAEMGA